ncbi:MAG TPA: acyl-CoA dehydrogenase family protein [Alphaproteobacteria bacterium]|jgi:alkylation response protein AidB-like acyl-CoA dehydrogenase
MSIIGSRWIDLVNEIGPGFAAKAAKAGDSDAFVAENYAVLKQKKLFSAQVPPEFGGGGARHPEICAALRGLARHCPSTALALSMHQHLVSAALHNHRKGKPGQKLLEAVGGKELVLVSTGANDWLASSGEAKKVEGGFRVSGTKTFASGSPMGDLLATSAPYQDPKEGWQVLHFPVPIKSEGVTVNDDWRAMGMRGTGSGSVTLKDVFVPEAAVAVRRPRARYHGVWNVIIVCAMPTIMSVYVGVAEEAAERAVAAARKRPQGVLPQLLGELENHLTTARLAVDSMVALASDLDFEPSNERANAVLVRKTIAANAVIAACAKALEAAGGAGYLRPTGIETLLRDAYAGQFHPLPERKQQEFTGRMALGLDPVA